MPDNVSFTYDFAQQCNLQLSDGYMMAGLMSHNVIWWIRCYCRSELKNVYRLWICFTLDYKRGYTICWAPLMLQSLGICQTSYITHFAHIIIRATSIHYCDIWWYSHVYISISLSWVIVIVMMQISHCPQLGGCRRNMWFCTIWLWWPPCKGAIVVGLTASSSTTYISPLPPPQPSPEASTVVEL